jgi:hypothetical protein
LEKISSPCLLFLSSIFPLFVSIDGSLPGNERHKVKKRRNALNAAAQNFGKPGKLLVFISPSLNPQHNLIDNNFIK